jgi:hypothetical protein
MKNIENEIISIIKENKKDIINQEDLFDDPFIEDWFYYKDTYTINVYCDEYEPEKVSIIAYGLKARGSSVLDCMGIILNYETNWDNEIFRKEMALKEFLEL